MATLPIEIITSILTHLPVKSLLRFKSVSKSWNSLITSPYFSNLHLQQSLSSTQNDRFLIINHGCFLKPGYIDPDHGNHPSYFSSVFLDSEFLSPATTLALPPQSKRVSAQICGSSNGLIAIIQKYVGDSICFLTGNFLYEVILWNPMINKTLTIPYYELPVGILNSVSFGLGYDFICNDYKVVRILDLLVRHVVGPVGGRISCCFTSRKRQVVVYSSKNQTWGTPCEEFTEDKLVLLQKSGTLLNQKTNIVHWVFFDNKTGIHKLRGFDICSESWTDLSLPDYLENSSLKSEDVKDLGVLNDCLCLVVKTEVIDANVWIMKEYGVKESWIKLFSISEMNVIGSLCSSPTAHSKNGDEILVRKGDSSDYFWFNMKNKSLKSVDYVVASLDVIVCNGSLVLVP